MGLKEVARQSDAQYQMPHAIRELFKARQGASFDYAANAHNGWLLAFAACAGAFGEKATAERGTRARTTRTKPHGGAVGWRAAGAVAGARWLAASRP